MLFIDNRLRRCFSFLLLLLYVMCFLGACQTREIAGSGAVSKAAKLGKRIFFDDFERTALGKDWGRGKGEGGTGSWVLRQGAMEGKNIMNDPLWLHTPLPRKVRVEFDATALSTDGDLKFEIFGDGITHASGYVVIFGGWKNSLDVIARLDEHGRDRVAKTSMRVRSNRTYHVAVERKGDTLRWFLDGKQILAYKDKAPLRGAGHQFFALNNWMAPVRFDNVAVYDLGP